MVRAVTLSLTATALAVTAVAAQESDPEIDRLRARLDAMTPRLLELEPLAKEESATRASRRARAQGVKTDTIRVGALTVVTPQGQSGVAERAVRSALRFHGPILEGAESLVNAMPWGVQLYDRTEVELGIWKPGIRTAAMPRSSGVVALERRVSDVLGQTLADALPRALQSWAGSAPLVEPGPGAGYTMEDLYRAGTASGSAAVTRCMEGDVQACWSVLGFPRADVPALEWYTEEELRWRARRAVGLWSTARGFELRAEIDPRVEEIWALGVDQRMDACLNGDTLACSLSLGPTADRPPLPMVARTSLLVSALKAGGAGSFARLRAASSDDVRTLLEVASGQDADALVRDWAAELASARPASHDNLAGTGAIALAWLLAFAGVGAAGSGRRTS